MKGASKAAKFCVSGCLPIADPGIEIDELGALPIPLKPKSIRPLIATDLVNV